MHRSSLKNIHKIHYITAKFAFCSIAGILYVLLGLYGHMYAPGPQHHDVLFKVRSKSSVHEIAQSLEQQGLIRSSLLFESYLYIKNHDRRLKKGDYVFDSGISPATIADTILNGYGIYYRLMIPSGLTNHQVLSLLTDYDFLQADSYSLPIEGTLFPDTYKVEGGTFYSAMIQRMHNRMLDELNEVWVHRSPSLFLKTPDEVLILASIVEKETHIKDERHVIAGVFINRLIKGMKLQSDPTTIYGLSGGKGKLGRPILLRDLKHKNEFNTYYIKGLPPTPICNPSGAALKAVTHPLPSSYLFFVADGSGGHKFAIHYSEHNKNIEAFRRFLRSKPQRYTP